MIDPNERLKRVYTGVIEKIDERDSAYYTAQEELSGEQWQIQPTDRSMLNYHYNLGAVEALKRVKTLFKIWGGTEEEWFKSLQVKDK